MIRWTRLTRRTLHSAAPILFLAAAMLPIAAAQPAATQPAKQPTKKTTKPASPAAPGKAEPPNGPLVEWADELFHLDSIGLTMHMPVGARTQQIQIAEQSTVQILPPDSSWIINLRTPVTSNASSTALEALEQTIALIQGQVGVVDPLQKQVLSTQAKVLDRTDQLQIPDLPVAARAYILVPRSSGDSPVVKGYTFFKTTPTQYVLFELLAPEASFPRARTVYETTIATVKFADQSAVLAARGSAVKSGIGFFQRLTPADYTAALGKAETWQRLYLPANSGAPADATEFGYRGLKFWQGKRGEINPDTPRSRWKDDENRDGILAQLTVRLLQEGNIIDSVARYFMTADRAEEAWSVRMIQKDKTGKEMGRWTETAVRSGNDVNVLVQEPGKKPTPIVPYIQGEGYISQVDAYLLPSLLINAAVKDSLDGDFAFYTYTSASETIAIRTDTVARDTQAGGVWTISTRFRDEAKPQRSIFNDRGDFTRTELPDGRRWEPIELATLKRLWQDKGLPTNK